MPHRKQITIPQELRLFSKPTALICLSHDRAMVYEVKADILREIAFWHTQDTDFSYSDKESFDHHGQGSFDTFFKPGTDGHNKEHYLHVFFNFFTKKLKEMDEQHVFNEIFIFLPEDIKNIATEKTPTYLKDKIHMIPGNVQHEHPLELLKRIEKNLENI